MKTVLRSITNAARFASQLIVIKILINLDALKMEYGDIVCRLEKLLDEGEISEYIKCTIVDMSNKVVEHLAKKYENVREVVKSVMGGKVLDYEAKRIKNEGRREGKLEGRLEILFDLVNDKLLFVKDAASRAELTEEVFQEKMNHYHTK